MVQCYLIGREGDSGMYQKSRRGRKAAGSGASGMSLTMAPSGRGIKPLALCVVHDLI